MRLPAPPPAAPGGPAARLLRRWAGSRVRRRLVLGFYAVLLLAVAGAVLALVVTAMSRAGSFSDRLAETGDWLAAGTLALAAVAGLVALQAYASATGPPDLVLHVDFEADQHVWRMAEPPDKVHVDGPISITIWIRNLSSYSARNPAVVLNVVRAGFASANGMAEGWTVTVGDNTAWFGAQWDGGPVYSIHGHSVRQLRFNLSSMVVSDGAYINVDLLAEGYSRQVKVLLVEPGWDDHSWKIPPFRTKVNEPYWS